MPARHFSVRESFSLGLRDLQGPGRGRKDRHPGGEQETCGLRQLVPSPVRLLVRGPAGAGQRDGGGVQDHGRPGQAAYFGHTEGPFLQGALYRGPADTGRERRLSAVYKQRNAVRRKGARRKAHGARDEGTRNRAQGSREPPGASFPVLAPCAVCLVPFPHTLDKHNLATLITRAGNSMTGMRR
jgi:hypothetical protein